MSTPNGFHIHNFAIPFSEIVNYFSNYNHLFFFCQKGIQTAIEIAAELTLRSISDYNPLTCDESLLNSVVRDIEVFQARNPHPNLEDSEFLFQIEIACGQIEEFVDFYIRDKLPSNQQVSISKRFWNGDNLVFDLRVF